jgi:hypothetical protein
MKDPTIPPADVRKKIMFYDSEDRQARLRIRCDFDGITQSQFFRMMLTGYIENDELVCTYLKQYKEKYNIQGKNKRDKIDRIVKSAAEKKQKFNLETEEIENIFDIIATETGL